MPPFNFAATKLLLRENVMDVLSVSAIYKQDSAATPLTDPVRVRWHDKIVRQGIIDGEAAQIYEGVDQVVFWIADLTERAITPARGTILTLTEYGITVELDAQIDVDGPGEEKWTVIRK
jgi:hypothetical protein